MTPIRVAIGLMIIAALMGFFVGKGASPWLLLSLPFAAAGYIGANKESRK